MPAPGPAQPQLGQTRPQQPPPPPAPTQLPPPGVPPSAYPRPSEPPADPAATQDSHSDEANGPEPSEGGDGDATLALQAEGLAASTDGDWLERICPYLLSEDGTYRSNQPDSGHRCTAQDPPGTLPSAFQERFCLTDRHVRCEMFKYAQSARSAALEQEGIPADQVDTARFRPSVRSVPVALGPSGRAAGSASGGSRRAIVVAAGIALIVIIVVLVVLMLSGSDEPGAGPIADASPSAQPTAAPTPTPEPTLQPTRRTTPQPDATTAPTDVPDPVLREIEYEVQEGEALLRIADAFGVSRRRIIRANEGMAEKQPYVEAGDVIIVPISADLAEEDISATPGFVRFIE